MMAVTAFWLSGLAAGQYTGSFNIDIPFGKLETLLTVGFESCQSHIRIDQQVIITMVGNVSCNPIDTILTVLEESNSQFL